MRNKLPVAQQQRFHLPEYIADAALRRYQIHMLGEDLVDEIGTVRPIAVGHCVDLTNHIVGEHQTVQRFFHRFVTSLSVYHPICNLSS